MAYTKINVNPYSVTSDKQWLFWNEWPDKTILQFELIDYWKAPTIKPLHGEYTVYYAISNQDIEGTGVKSGDEIILFITTRAFIIALNHLPKEFKTPCNQAMSEGKNVLIDIERINNERLKVHRQYLKEPTQEQLAEAQKQYDKIVNEQKERRRDYAGRE